MTETDTEQAQDILDQFGETPDNLIPILQEVQSKFYFLPEDVLRGISRKLHIPLTNVYQVATFYRCFSLEPRGKHLVQVCLGTACHVRGAARVLDRLLRELKLTVPGTTADFEFTVETVRCIGCCGLAPVMRVDSSTQPHLTQTKVQGVLKKYRREENETAAVSEEVVQD